MGSGLVEKQSDVGITAPAHQNESFFQVVTLKLEADPGRDERLRARAIVKSEVRKAQPPLTQMILIPVNIANKTVPRRPRPVPWP